MVFEVDGGVVVDSEQFVGTGCRTVIGCFGGCQKAAKQIGKPFADCPVWISDRFLGGSFSPRECDDVHVMMGLLKQFIREIPGGLIPTDLYSHFIDVGDDSELLRQAVSKLRVVHFHVISYLISFIQLIASQCEVNKMTLQNLTVVFGPNFFAIAQQPTDPSNLLANFSKESAVMMTMLLKWKELFADSVVDATVNADAIISAQQVIDSASATIAPSPTQGSSASTPSFSSPNQSPETASIHSLSPKRASAHSSLQSVVDELKQKLQGGVAKLNALNDSHKAQNNIHRSVETVRTDVANSVFGDSPLHPLPHPTKLRPRFARNHSSLMNISVNTKEVGTDLKSPNNIRSILTKSGKHTGSPSIVDILSPSKQVRFASDDIAPTISPVISTNFSTSLSSLSFKPIHTIEVKSVLSPPTTTDELSAISPISPASITSDNEQSSHVTQRSFNGKSLHLLHEKNAASNGQSANVWIPPSTNPFSIFTPNQSSEIEIESAAFFTKSSLKPPTPLLPSSEARNLLTRRIRIYETLDQSLSVDTGISASQKPPTLPYASISTQVNTGKPLPNPLKDYDPPDLISNHAVHSSRENQENRHMSTNDVIFRENEERLERNVNAFLELERVMATPVHLLSFDEIETHKSQCHRLFLTLNSWREHLSQETNNQDSPSNLKKQFKLSLGRFNRFKDYLRSAPSSPQPPLTAPPATRGELKRRVLDLKQSIQILQKNNPNWEQTPALLVDIRRFYADLKIAHESYIALEKQLVPSSSTQKSATISPVLGLEQLRQEKQSLQRILHKFQSDFYETNQRAPSTDLDRKPMLETYQRYKHLRSLLRTSLL